MIRYLETRVYVLAVSFAVAIHTTAIEVNIAINKMASQSGDLNWPEASTKFWKAGTAVDGHKSCDNVSSDFYSGTANYQNPWWQVDLGRLYNISKVIVYGKQNPGHAYQYDNFMLYATPDNDTIGSENRATHPDSTHPEYDQIQGPMVGRFITIELQTLINRQPHPLVLCEVEVYAEAVNIATRATLTASTKLEFQQHDYRKENAVDGKVGNPDLCNCCYSSANMASPSFTAAFSLPFEVYRIEIQGRTNGNENSHLSYISVNIDDMPATVKPGTEGNSRVIIPNNQRLQKITISRSEPPGHWDGWFLMICELRIFAVCEYEWFGVNCAGTCHCYENANCASDTGICPDHVPLCAPGWQGTSCNKKCGHGTFGSNCTKRCHCYSDANCSNDQGICPYNQPRCAPGWQEQSCDQECGHGAFGSDCLGRCHCSNNANCTYDQGICPYNKSRCASGWQGRTCNEECGHGAFGSDCLGRCHCYNDKYCLRQNGSCPLNNPLCALGWQGNNCATECGHGAFGYDCLWRCHCYNDNDCLRQNGSCLTNDPLCAAGWQGNNCAIVCDYGRFGVNCAGICHCYEDANCASDTGLCPDHEPLCAPGWQGTSCNKMCDHGSFGVNCAGTCHCYEDANCTSDTGLCLDNKTLCAPGWQGRSCEHLCSAATFGLNCSQHCYCYNDNTCSNVQGICPDTQPRCAPGWRESSCDKECELRTFGLNCSEECHCFNNTNCTPANGTCPDVLNPCEAGWKGRSCDQVVEAMQQTGGNGVTVPAVVGVVGALVVIAVISVAVFIKRRQQLATARPGSNYAPNNEVRLEDSKLKHVPLVKPNNNLPDGQQNDGFENEAGEHEYYLFSSTTSEIKPYNLWFYIRKMQADNCKSFYEEFESLPHGLKLSYRAAMIQENRTKNRYREMYAYDHSRVVLNITRPGQTDYINASHIHGFEKTKKFIASQGPTDKMTNDFWRMVWQQNVEIIVMLTNVMENGNKKCEKYWPDDDKVEAYGEVKVKVIRTDMFVDHYTRQMEISMEGKPTRTVTQFHFRSWPDKDVPDSSWCLVNFWRAASRHPSGDAPIVVHCSAGIGRTGTYIALDYLYNQLQQEGSVRPFQAVHALRRQRVNLVQTREQYAYMHEAVADAIGLGTHFIWASQFQEYYDYMTHLQPGASKSPLQIQFELAVQSQRENKVAGESAETLADETYANADVAAEINAYRPQIKKRNSNNIKEMGAMYLPIYSGAEGFLIAKSPTEKSLVEICSLVHEHNVKTVISLCDSTTKNYRACANLGVDTGALGGFFQVTVLDATKFRSYDERTYTLNEHGKEDGSRATLKVFDYKAWKSGYNTPAEARSMLELLDAVTRWQPHISEAQPILVHCNNGTRRSGLVCLVLSELQRLKREDGQVNILDSLMQLKQRNMDVIENEGQYQYCFDVIRTYVQQSKEESVQVQKDQDQHIYTNM